MDQGLTFKYDEHADVLYISVGQPKPAVSEELEDGVVVRLDPRTKKIVGLTIIDFRTVFLKAPKRLPFVLQPA